MKNIIDENLSVRITGDTMDNISVSRIDRRVNTYLDEMYLADEDGEVLIDNKLVPFKAGDLLLKFNIWNSKSDMPVMNRTFVVPNDNSLVIGLKKVIDEAI